MLQRIGVSKPLPGETQVCTCACLNFGMHTVEVLKSTKYPFLCMQDQEGEMKKAESEGMCFIYEMFNSLLSSSLVLMKLN